MCIRDRYPTEQQPSFENTMDSILNLLNSFEGFVGMELRNLSSNQVLLSFNEDKLFTPASLSKIITALISLESLGTNYRFETQVFRSSPITSNYNGNIYIKGFGNPVLSSDEYKYILKKATVDQGITKLYGNIVFDYSFLTEEGFGRGWMWDDPQDVYKRQIKGSIYSSFNIGYPKTPCLTLSSKTSITSGGDLKSISATHIGIISFLP